MKVIRLRFVGVTPLLMHNAQLVDPENEYVVAIKAITAKKTKKTDEDLSELKRLEWYGGLYLNDDLRPCIPGENAEAAIRDGARCTSKGKDVERGILCDGNFPVIYDGPKDIDDLYDDKRFVDVRSVVVGKSRVMRTRPKFTSWSVEIDVAFNPSIIKSADSVVEFATQAGIQKGIMDGRPKFGRFSVEVI